MMDFATWLAFVAAVNALGCALLAGRTRAGARRPIVTRRLEGMGRAVLVAMGVMTAAIRRA